MTVRRILLLAYPRSWREEYGEELAAILAQSALTPAAIANVLASGMRQRIRTAAPWKICSAGMVVWTSLVLISAVLRVFPYPPFVWCYTAGFLFVFAAGLWTVSREPAGFWRGVAASAKAALLPALLSLVVYGSRVLRRPAVVFGHSMYFWVWYNAAIVVVLSLLFGTAGALLGGLITRSRRVRRRA